MFERFKILIIWKEEIEAAKLFFSSLNSSLIVYEVGLCLLDTALEAYCVL